MVRPELGEFYIVMRGRFNPAPFQPSWFAEQQLLRQDEVANPRLHVFHAAVVGFSIAWLSVHVERDRFQISTSEEAYLEPLRDIALGILEIVEEIDPLLLGINRIGHYSLENRRQLDHIGYRIAPKEPWDDLLESEGLSSGTIQGKRPDDHKGYIRVKVEPSVKVPGGVFIDVNDHYELREVTEETEKAEESEESKEGEGTKLAREILSDLWKDSQERSQRITDTVLSWRNA